MIRAEPGWQLVCTLFPCPGRQQLCSGAKLLCWGRSSWAALLLLFEQGLLLLGRALLLLLL